MKNHSESIQTQVLLPLGAKKNFSYLHEGTILEEGQLVEVEFRTKDMVGMVIEQKSPQEHKKDLRLKNIKKLLPYKLSARFINFIKKVSVFTITDIGIIFKMCLADLSGGNNDKPSNTEDIKLNIKLSEIQQCAVMQIIENKDKPILLEGITGSGKTEVYCSAIYEIIKQEGQALILLPEITLATQISQRIASIFCIEKIANWHSGISKAHKRKLWKDIINGNIKIVIGARSSLFLPFKNLKVIVVDEEHDQSFKQEDTVIYNARDMAVLRAHEEQCSIILASATPSLESYQNSKTGKYKMIKLNQRFGKSILPKIKIVDMHKKSTNSSRWISDELINEIYNTMQMQKQSILFLNKKGYATTSICLKCGYREKCPNCTFSLVLHKTLNLLMCHYCNYTTAVSTYCKNCSNQKISLRGIGIEKIEEEVKLLFPKANVLSIDSKIISNHNKAKEIFDKISNKEFDIIIGTQIISKGLDFESIHLVGVIQADPYYHDGDIRGIERSYQLLNQVAGRAGRKEQQGIVLMQSYEPSNTILLDALFEKEKFLENELLDRKESNMPPFTRLISINAASKDETKLINYMTDLKDNAPTIEILGPAPSPMNMIKQQYRYRIIIKSDKSLKIQKIVKNWIDSVKKPSSIHVSIDVDPYNFL